MLDTGCRPRALEAAAPNHSQDGALNGPGSCNRATWTTANKEDSYFSILSFSLLDVFEVQDTVPVFPVGKAYIVHHARTESMQRVERQAA